MCFFIIQNPKGHVHRERAFDAGAEQVTYQQVARVGVGCHGLVLEGVGLDQRLLLPALPLPGVVVVQLVQALRARGQRSMIRKEKVTGSSPLLDLGLNTSRLSFNLTGRLTAEGWIVP